MRALPSALLNDDDKLGILPLNIRKVFYDTPFLIIWQS
jgi:hypothetical protein